MIPLMKSAFFDEEATRKALADFILSRDLAPGSTLIVDRREEVLENEAPVEIRVIEGAPVPAAVGAPDDEPELADDIADDASDD